MKYLPLIMLLAGCSTYPAVSQPRALGIGGLQPSCVILCIQNVSFSDAEGQGNATGSTSTQSATLQVTP